MDNNNNLNNNYQEDKINIKKYLFLVISNWYWIIICLLIALMVAYLINRYTMPTYTASATVLLENDEGSDDILSGLRFVRYWRQKENVQNEIAKIKSFQMARRTLEKLDFEIEYTAHGRIKEIKKYRDASIEVVLDTGHTQVKNNPLTVHFINNKKYRLISADEKTIDTVVRFGEPFINNNYAFVIQKRDSSFGHIEYSFTIKDNVQLANQYKNKLNAEPLSEESTVINLSINGYVPEKLVNYLNAFCKEYIQYGLDIKNQRAENTMVFIDGQIQRILDSLTSVEKQLLHFKTSNEIIDLSQKGQLAFEKIKQYHQEKSKLDFKKEYLYYLLEYVNDHTKNQAIIAPSLMYSEEPLLMGLIKQLDELHQEQEELSVAAKSNNPGLRAITQKIALTKNQIIENLKSTIHTNQLNINKLNNEIAKVEKTLLQLPVQERSLLNIQRKYDLNNKFYTFLLEKRAEAGIEKASNIPDSKVLDGARIENVKKLGPDKKMTLMMALALGLAFPVGILVLLDFFNNKITSREDIEKNTSLPMVGTVGHSHSRTELPVIESPKSSLAESFRHLRTNLKYILKDPSQKTVMVTSTISGEGKTFFAINLAAIMALAGKKVLLIGLDLRRPKLHSVFKIDNQQGLSTYLINKSTLEDIIHPTNVDNLFIVNSGPIPPNPAELIESKEMDQLMQSLKEQYDFIVADTPPVALVADALLFGKHADASLFIIRQNYSRKDALELINNLQAKNRLANMNLVVNDIKAYQALGYSYYYGYGYGYGYYYGYGYNKKHEKGYYSHTSDQKKRKKFFNIS